MAVDREVSGHAACSPSEQAALSNRDPGAVVRDGCAHTDRGSQRTYLSLDPACIAADDLGAAVREHGSRYRLGSADDRRGHAARCDTRGLIRSGTDSERLLPQATVSRALSCTGLAAGRLAGSRANEDETMLSVDPTVIDAMTNGPGTRRAHRGSPPLDVTSSGRRPRRVMRLGGDRLVEPSQAALIDP